MLAASRRSYSATLGVGTCTRDGREILRFQLHVLPRDVIDLLDLVRAQEAHAARGIPDPELAVADDATLRHDRARADECMPLDEAAVHDRRAHADQARVLHRAAVQHGAVADRDVGADRDREAAERVLRVVRDEHQRAVLDVRALADADAMRVAANDGGRPDRGIVSHRDVADDMGGGIDVCGRRNLRAEPVERADTAHLRCVLAAPARIHLPRKAARQNLYVFTGCAHAAFDTAFTRARA